MRAHNPGRRQNQSTGRKIRKPERANHSPHINNREIMEEGMEKKKREDSMTKTS
jgi:hypothetical protein